VTRHFVSTGNTLEPVGIISLFAVASIPICYIAGSVHLRNTRGRVADLMSITREGVDRKQWRETLSATLRDPGVEVFWWDDERGGYRDEDEHPVELPVDADSPTRTLLPITAGDGSPIAVIRHDRALAENERLLDGVSTALRLSMDNRQLRGEIERTLDQVRESRQRIVEAGDEARKRLERDLHDGSQQQLVALAMQLRTVITSARNAGQDDVADELEGLLTRLSVALRELRELARGIHPTALVEGGLALALPELASRCPVPVVVEADLPERMPELVESTGYFVASECLANIARHSQARQAWLRAEREGETLRLTVRDNGRGGADHSAGSGIRGLADRVEAIGGTLELRSPHGEGTTIVVTLPLADPTEAGLG
jgi:signal transduction histidine kinase